MQTSRIVDSLPAALPLALALLLFSSPAALAAPRRDTARVAQRATESTGALWFQLAVDGTPAGWAMERIERNDGRVTTTSKMELRVRRGGADLTIALASRFVETAGGAPVSLWQRQTLGQLPVESTFRFVSTPSGERVEVTSVQADRKTRETRPVPAGSWLTPDAARRAVVAHRRAGDARYTMRLIDPFQGLDPIRVERRLLGGGTVPGAVDRWQETQLPPAAAGPERAASGAAGAAQAPAGTIAPEQTSILELDADGRLVASTTRFLGLELTLRRTDRKSALAAVDGATVPEMMVSTVVRPDRKIPAPRRLRHATYELSLTPASDGATWTLPPLPETGAQVVHQEGDHARVEISVLPGDTPPLPADADGAAAIDPTPYLAPSAFLDTRDPAIRALVRAADPAPRVRPADADPGAPATAEADRSTGGETPRERAARLTALVRERITDKNFDTGFATASEVARTLAGDCTEHAVLLAALLRADGIPSRVASGVVYLDRFAGAQDVFGYHMWAQALIGGRWVDFDAALPGDIAGFDATHIALATSSLSGPESAADFAPLSGLIGHLAIRVLDLKY